MMYATVSGQMIGASHALRILSQAPSPHHAGAGETGDAMSRAAPAPKALLPPMASTRIFLSLNAAEQAYGAGSIAMAPVRGALEPIEIAPALTQSVTRGGEAGASTRAEPPQSAQNAGLRSIDTDQTDQSGAPPTLAPSEGVGAEISLREDRLAERLGRDERAIEIKAGLTPLSERQSSPGEAPHEAGSEDTPFNAPASFNAPARFDQALYDALAPNPLLDMRLPGLQQYYAFALQERHSVWGRA
jgi:hypothetical protein